MVFVGKMQIDQLKPKAARNKKQKISDSIHVFKDILVLGVSIIPVHEVFVQLGNTRYDMAILQMPFVLLKMYFTVELISK